MPRKWALFGIVVVCIAGVTTCVYWTREHVRATMCRANLYQVASSVYDIDGVSSHLLPPAILRDSHGKGAHSWRTLASERMNFDSAIQYTFSEPWNGPANRAYAAGKPGRSLFTCPCDARDADSGCASYVAVVGERTLWQEEWRDLQALGPEVQSKILLIEVPSTDIGWTEPRDISLDEAVRLFSDPQGLKAARHPKGLHYITVDLQIRPISSISTVERFLEMLQVPSTTERDAPEVTSGAPQVVASDSSSWLSVETVQPVPQLMEGTPPATAVAPFDAPTAREQQNAWAAFVQRPRELTNSNGMPLVLIPPGEFLMGASPADVSEDRSWARRWPRHPATPRHRVILTRPFYLGTCEVTVEQFRRFVKATGYRTSAEQRGWGGYRWNQDTAHFERRDPNCNWTEPGYAQTDNQPVVNVSWRDAVAFCRYLSSLEQEMAAGRVYLLPSEAQWEYACRAGTTTPYYVGEVLDIEDGNCVPGSAQSTSNEKTPSRPKPVRSYAPNAFGLFDMHGNVSEWCADWFDWAYYLHTPLKDPAGPDVALDRTCRGGGWHQDSGCARSWHRESASPRGFASNTTGFRVVAVLVTRH